MRKFSVIIVSNVSSVCSSLCLSSGIHITFVLHFCIFPTVPEFWVCLFVFFSVFDLPAFQFWRFLLRHPQILSSPVSSLLISSSETFFISVAMFLIYRISCWFFLKFPSLCYLTLLCLQSTLSIRDLSVLIVVVLNS